MKSTEVYALLKADLAPWFKANGFKRAKGLLSWSRPVGEGHIVVWCQVSQDGWDEFSGSKFTVELQRSVAPVVGAHPSHRHRMASLLDSEQREMLRSVQNAVIASLAPPSQSHAALHVSPKVSEWYLAQFQAVGAPYPANKDIWFRYSSPEHLACWSRFILQNLSRCVAAAEGWG